MSYEIPQQLEYKEKIMFGLTFKQLAYAFLFVGNSLLILKATDYSIFGIVLSIFPCLLGIGFVYLNFDLLIKDYFIYYKSRKIIINEQDRNHFLGIENVKDNYIFTSKKKRIAIFKIFPINFSIKQQEEKNATISSFQKFLNALDFPTQLLITTESIDIQSYLKSVKLRSEKNPYPELLNQHEKHLKESVNNKKIMNRVFYLIILEKENIEIQVDLCKDRLSSLNLKYDLLKTKDLENLIKKFIPLKGVNLNKKVKNG